MRHRLYRCWIGLGLLTVLPLTHAQAPDLIADINDEHGPAVSSSPRSLVTVADAFTLFVGLEPGTGRELWRSDGTPGGTELVADILPGHESSYPGSLVAFKDRVFFAADDGTHGNELWVSDGTPAGTRMVRDINPGRPSSFVRQLTPFNGEVYFQARDPDIGTELWKTDGTESGTVRVTDLVPGAGSSVPSLLTVVGGMLMFSAYREAEGREFWRLDRDGDLALLQDLNPGPQSSVGRSSGSGLVGIVDGLLVAAANDGLHGTEPWVLDPADPRNNRLLADIAPGPDDGCCSGFVLHEGLVYFKAGGPTPGLWSTDGRSAAFIVELEGQFIAPILSWNGFIAIYSDTQSFGEELWVSDGSAAGTGLLKDINPGAADAKPRELTVVGGTLFFGATDAGGEKELWRSDGTAAGTVPVTNINAQQSGWPRLPATGVLNGSLLFAAQEAASGTELWISDGSVAGTLPVANIAPDRDSAHVANLASIGQRTVFTAFRPDVGTELWTTDGTSVELLADALPGTGSGLGSTSLLAVPMLAVDETLFFFADTNEYGGGFRFGTRQDLWRTDGTVAGTRRVADFNLDQDQGDFRFGRDDQPLWAALNDALYLMVDGDDGRGLYRIDPETDAVTFVAAVFSDETAILGPNMAATQDHLFFGTATGPTGAELWRSDGTAAGTVPVSQLVGARPRWLTATTGTLFFIAGRNVWRVDGAGVDAFPLTSFPQEGTNAHPRFLTAHQDRLFFVVDDGVSGYELWVSDGSVAGTRRVKDINPGPDSSRPFALTSGSDGLYFAAYTPSAGVELWRSDGTEAGTRQVADIVPGAGSGLPWSPVYNDFPPYVLLPFAPETPSLPPIEIYELPNGRMLFRAWDPAAGSELWVTDGSAGGTVPLTDIAPGPGNANPAFFTASGDAVLFSADDGLLGRELWKIDLSALPTGAVFADGFE